jgi:hypothetical protein
VRRERELPGRRLVADDDEPVEVVVLCPECAEREFAS